MGILDDIFGQPFGGMFDVNRDGKTDPAEEWLGYMVMSECTKENDEDSHEEILGFDLRDLLREEGIKYGVYPEDYDSEEEFVTALEETVDALLASYGDDYENSIG